MRKKVKLEERGTPSPRGPMSPFPPAHLRASPSPRYMQLVSGGGGGYHGPPPNVMVQQPQQPHPGMPGPPPQMMPGPPTGPAPPGHPQHHLLLDSGMRVGPGMHGPPGGFIPHSFNLESRIYDMNKRIMQRIEKDNDNAAQWWEAFGNEFFDDHARLSLQCHLDNDPKKYMIGRTLIPRYFRSIFDGGVKDLFYVLRGPSREFMPRPDILVLEVENAAIVTRHEKPQFTEVNTEGRLTVEFRISEEQYGQLPPRIHFWLFEIRNHQEFVHRNVLSSLSSESQEQLSKNITRQGMTSVTLNYLRLCLILEPMQNLMSIEKGHRISPRECLHHYNFQRHSAIHPPRRPPPPISQPIIPPMEVEPPRQAPKRKRNRKGSASGGNTPTGGKKKGAAAAASPAPGPTAPAFPIASHVDVMVVGEPSLMGGDGGEEDERMISRLENTQFDAGMPPHPMHPDQGRGTPFEGLWRGPGGGSRGATPQGRGDPPASSPSLRIIKSEGLEGPAHTPPIHQP